jgi:hypothetical protein
MHSVRRLATRLLSGALALAPVAALVAAATAALPGHAAAQDDGRRDSRAFTWEGRIPEGRWIYVRNLNGPVRVERGSGSQVEVVAERRWGRDADPERVRFESRRARDGQSMIVCALWDEDAECDEDGMSSGRRGGWREDGGDRWVSVHFTVRVPAGVRADMRTVNGGIEVRGATAEVVARTVNGSVRAETEGGPVSARSVNGSITASMRAVGREDLDFSTTNGSVTVEMPRSLGAEVEMSTVNGRVNTEFPVTVSGRIDPKRLRATIGSGGPRLRLRTVNGSVDLRRVDE